MRCGPIAGLIACALVLGTAAVPGSGGAESASVGVELDAVRIEMEAGDGARAPVAARVGAPPAAVDGWVDGRVERRSGRGAAPARTAHFTPAAPPAPPVGASTR